MKLPVISSQMPVLEKVITHRKNGLFISIGDYESLAEFILILHDDKELRTRLGNNGRNYVMSKHTFSSYENRLVSLYESLNKTNKLS